VLLDHFLGARHPLVTQSFEHRGILIVQASTRLMGSVPSQTN
jgi:hypothetical protein